MIRNPWRLFPRDDIGASLNRSDRRRCPGDGGAATIRPARLVHGCLRVRVRAGEARQHPACHFYTRNTVRLATDVRGILRTPAGEAPRQMTREFDPTPIVRLELCELIAPARSGKSRSAATAIAVISYSTCSSTPVVRRATRRLPGAARRGFQALIGTTSPFAGADLAQKFAHAPISSRRFSSRSPR